MKTLTSNAFTLCVTYFQYADGLESTFTKLLAALSKAKINATNIQDYDDQLFQAALESYGDEDLTKFINSDVKQTAEYKGATYKALRGKIRAKKARLLAKLMSHWNKASKGAKGKAERKPRTMEQRDVEALHPRLVAYQKLTEPTVQQGQRMSMIRTIIDDAIASCPKAKTKFAELEKAVEDGKKSK